MYPPYASFRGVWGRPCVGIDGAMRRAFHVGCVEVRCKDSERRRSRAVPALFETICASRTSDLRLHVAKDPAAKLFDGVVRWRLEVHPWQMSPPCRSCMHRGPSCCSWWTRCTAITRRKQTCALRGVAAAAVDGMHAAAGRRDTPQAHAYGCVVRDDGGRGGREMRGGKRLRDADGTRQEEMIGQQVDLLTNQLSHKLRG